MAVSSSRFALLLLLATSSSSSSSSAPAPVTLSVDAASAAGAVSPLLWSAFIEDIGHSVTGGLHAELVADGQMRGPAFAGPAPAATPRVTLGATSTANAGRALRFCGGTLMATLDGSGDATFELVTPGLAGGGGATASLRALLMPNTGSAAGDFVVVAADGASLREAAPDGSAEFNASATFALADLGGGLVSLAATAPPERAAWRARSASASAISALTASAGVAALRRGGILARRRGRVRRLTAARRPCPPDR